MSDDTVAIEFDILMARAGIAIPADRRGAMLGQYRDLHKQIALLHAQHPATLEPSNVFRVASPEGDTP